jgi:protein TonB
VKRYPTSREARLQRPQGKARLWLEVGRDGGLRDAGLEETSGSMILDNAALSAVRQGRYPAFPAQAWAGRDAHRFTVTLEYTLEPG